MAQPDGGALKRRHSHSASLTAATRRSIQLVAPRYIHLVPCSPVAPQQSHVSPCQRERVTVPLCETHGSRPHRSIGTQPPHRWHCSSVSQCGPSTHPAAFGSRLRQHVHTPCTMSARRSFWSSSRDVLSVTHRRKVCTREAPCAWRSRHPCWSAETRGPMTIASRPDRIPTVGPTSPGAGGDAGRARSGDAMRDAGDDSRGERGECTGDEASSSHATAAAAGTSSSSSPSGVGLAARLKTKGALPATRADEGRGRPGCQLVFEAASAATAAAAAARRADAGLAGGVGCLGSAVDECRAGSTSGQ